MKEFKSESKRLLDIMVNSIYTHKEIFLRELISNSSDAVSKRYYRDGGSREDYRIEIKPDKQARTLTVSDNGIGMTLQELEDYLGTIARSGSLSFKKDGESESDESIIGQFGVGFYSAFMVAKAVKVITKKDDTAYEWYSEGTDGYEIKEVEKEDIGTDIILYLKDDTEADGQPDEKYSNFLNEYEIKRLVKKYSDYIQVPIYMEEEFTPEADDGEEPAEKKPVTLNSMVPLWRKNKNELQESDYSDFFRHQFSEYNQPLTHLHLKAEGSVSYDALLYIPSKTPYGFYSKDYKKGLQLYSGGVMIMECCEELLPDYFSFVKGVVDSADLSLNISREMLQHDSRLRIIAKNIEKSIKSELEKMLKNDREEYDKFFAEFGAHLKYGIYNTFGMNKDLLADLLTYYSSSEKKFVTLKEYTERIKDGQEFIYYASGSSVTRIDAMPQVEQLKDSGYEILYCTDSVDEFTLKAMVQYTPKDGEPLNFKSVKDINDEDVPETDEYKELFAYMEESLGEAVTKVRASARLKTYPAALSTQGDLSLEMEKVIKSMPENVAGNSFKAQRILEINPNHAVFAKLQSLFDENKDALKTYTKLLYNTSLLIEGLPVEDPAEFSKQIAELMV